MEKRLVKIAKELNVGTSTIVDHLASKGFVIDNKPTAKVTDEMYEELLKEFQKSIAIKEQADQLVIGTRPTSKKETPPPPRPERPAPAPPSPAGQGGNGSAARESSAPETADEEARGNGPRLKILGKINLEDRLKSRRRDSSKPEPEPEPQAQAPTPPPAPEPAPPTAPEQPQPEIASAAPAPAPEPEPPRREEPAPPAEKAESTRAEAPQPEQPKKEMPSTPTPATTPETPARPATPPAAEQPADTKAETPASPDQLVRAEAPELRGLKILGKIDLGDRSGRRGGGGAGGGSGGSSGGNRDRREGGRREDDKKKAAPAGAAGGPQQPGQPGQQQQQGGGTTDPNRKRKRKRKKVSAPPTENRANQPGGGPPRGGGGGGGGGDDRRRGGPGGPPPRRQDEEPKEVSKREIEEKIKATMARMQGGSKKKRQRLRRDNRDRMRERQEARDLQTESGKLEVTEFISVQELANLMDVPVTDVIMTLMNAGIIVSINQRLDAEVIELVAEEFGHEVEFISVEDQTEEEDVYVDDPEDLRPRPPIVTVMGHVDHGKTSLLDYIREANVVGGEAGGITQHIGAYEVRTADGRQVTFLDTPGHEAFTAMRARGAKVTDIAIIIIAADDSIMPQTREAISHAEAAGVPIVFAINKIDKAGANPERIKQELASMNYLLEEWGGKYQSQDISALNGQGVDELLEKVLLEAELLDLKANPDRPAIGTLLEASLEKGRGYVAKTLVQHGTLRIGDPIVAGEQSGRVKAMFNERNKRVKEAGPATPVLVLGLDGAPQAGEIIKVTENEQDARQIASKRGQILREQANRATKRISLDEIGRRLALGNFKELNLIVKGDFDGSVEALSDSLIKLSQQTVQVNVIHKAVGQIIESDVLLASASDAIIVGFQVRPSLSARKLAEREGVQIKMYSIIYEAIEEIKSAIEGMLEPTREERIVAQVAIREVFKISKIGTVAGCYVEEGRITRQTPVRIIRDGIVVYPTREGVLTAEIESLKRFKDDVKEVRAGQECGISIKNFNDIKVGDTIEGYEIVMIKQKID